MAVLMDYVKKKAKEGMSLQEIHDYLVDNNFPDSLIDKTLEEYRDKYMPKPVVKKSRFQLLMEKFKKPKDEDHPFVKAAKKKDKHEFSDEHREPKKEIENEPTEISEEYKEEPKPKKKSRFKKLLDKFKIKKKSKEETEEPKSAKKKRSFFKKREEKPKSAEPKTIMPKYNPRMEKLKTITKEIFTNKWFYMGAGMIILVILGIMFVPQILSGIFSGIGSEESGEIVLPEIDCTGTGIAANAIWRDDTVHISITNTGNKDLQGFEAIALGSNLNTLPTVFENQYENIIMSESSDFRLTGLISCGEINTLTVRSLQCPDNAIHTLQRSQIANC